MHYHFDNNTPFSSLIYFIMKYVQYVKRLLVNQKIILKDAGIKEGMKILDYGCGIGNYTIETSKIIGESGSIIAADISKTMIDELEKHINRCNITNIVPLHIKKKDDIQENKFDFIFIIDVLHFIEKKIETIKFFLNKLADEGKILIKFEHFNKKKIIGIINRLEDIKSIQLNNDYWLLHISH